jgi:SNF2 family DNA or RNA helicase
MKDSFDEEMPSLHLSMLGNDIVCLDRNIAVDDSIWSNIKQWWQNESSTVVVSKSTIKIPLLIFFRSMQWIQTHWIMDNRKYTVSQDLSQAVKNIKDEGKRFNELLNNVSSPDEYDYSILKLKRNPTAFQIDNINRLLRMPSGANFSVPGAGKTTTTLIVWAALRKQKKLNRLLVIAPRSAFEAWHKDTRETFKQKFITSEFSNGPIDSSTDILIVNYEQLQKQKKLSRLSYWVEKNEAMVAIDEAHRIKGGSNSIRWYGVREVTAKAKRIDLLTGTPMPQGYSDLKNLYSISWPNISQNNFSESLLNSAQRGGIFVRTTKAELGLPEATLTQITVPMGKIQSDLYSALRRNYKGLFGLNTTDESFLRRKGKAVLTLIAVATNPGLLSEIRTEDSYLGLEWPSKEFSVDTNLLDMISNYASHEIPSKYTWVCKYVKKAASENRKVLVWSNFVGNLHALYKVLKPYYPSLIFGGVDDLSRKAELARFREDPNCHVLLTNPQTLGEGVSLHHECHDAIYVDRIFNAGLYLQSVDRIHRLGLSEDQSTRIFILNSDKSIDQRVSLSLEAKIERMSVALNDPSLVESAIPFDLDEILPSELIDLDKFDLDDLYAHLLND